MGAASALAVLVLGVAFLTRPPWEGAERARVQRSLTAHLEWVAGLSQGRHGVHREVRVGEDETAAPVGERKSASSTPDGV